MSSQTVTFPLKTALYIGHEAQSETVTVTVAVSSVQGAVAVTVYVKIYVPVVKPSKSTMFPAPITALPDGSVVIAQVPVASGVPPKEAPKSTVEVPSALSLQAEAVPLSPASGSSTMVT